MEWHDMGWDGMGWDGRGGGVLHCAVLRTIETITEHVVGDR